MSVTTLEEVFIKVGEGMEHTVDVMYVSRGADKGDEGAPPPPPMFFRDVGFQIRPNPMQNC